MSRCFFSISKVPKRHFISFVKYTQFSILFYSFGRWALYSRTWLGFFKKRENASSVNLNSLGCADDAEKCFCVLRFWFLSRCLPTPQPKTITVTMKMLFASCFKFTFSAFFLGRWIIFYLKFSQARKKSSPGSPSITARPSVIQLSILTRKFSFLQRNSRRRW